MAILGNTTLISGRCYGNFINDGKLLIGTSSELSSIPTVTSSDSNPLQVNGYAVAKGFKVTGLDDADDNLLLADGSTISTQVLLSAFSDQDYVKKSGDTMTGDLTMSKALINYSLSTSSASGSNTVNLMTCSDSGTNSSNLSILVFINGGGLPMLRLGDANLANIYLGTKVYVSKAGSVNAKTGFFQTSDIKKKTNLRDLNLNKCYDLIDKCQTVLFDYKEGAKDQMGMIAQEVEEFFPEIVSTDADGFKSLDYAKLTVVILRVLKDLIKKVNGSN